MGKGSGLIKAVGEDKEVQKRIRKRLKRHMTDDWAEAGLSQAVDTLTSLKVPLDLPGWDEDDLDHYDLLPLCKVVDPAVWGVAVEPVRIGDRLIGGTITEDNLHLLKGVREVVAAKLHHVDVFESVTTFIACQLEGCTIAPSGAQEWMGCDITGCLFLRSDSEQPLTFTECSVAMYQEAQVLSNRTLILRGGEWRQAMPTRLQVDRLLLDPGVSGLRVEGLAGAGVMMVAGSGKLYLGRLHLEAGRVGVAAGTTAEFALPPGHVQGCQPEPGSLRPA